MDRIPELPIHDEYLAYQITAINHGIDHVKAAGGDINQVSNDYHTFGELYEHRIELFITLCRFLGLSNDQREYFPFRSKYHSDGSSMKGWFLLGLQDYKNRPNRQITYHLPMSKWDDCNFAFTMAQAPEFDGHTSADVLKRLKEL